MRCEVIDETRAIVQPALLPRKLSVPVRSLRIKYNLPNDILYVAQRLWDGVTDHFRDPTGAFFNNAEKVKGPHGAHFSPACMK